MITESTGKVIALTRYPRRQSRLVLASRTALLVSQIVLVMAQISLVLIEIASAIASLLGRL